MIYDELCAQGVYNRIGCDFIYYPDIDEINAELNKYKSYVEEDKNLDPHPCRDCGQDTASCCGCEKERAWQIRNKGEWIIIDDCEKFIAKCSKCNSIIDSRHLKDYCPYCNSKMKK
jgi:hypothetical protein